MKLGIVGLPNVGKSTLFNAITKAGAEAANYPFCTIEPNVGVVTVPDSRIDTLHEVYNSKKTIYTSIEFCDSLVTSEKLLLLSTLFVALMTIISSMYQDRLIPSPILKQLTWSSSSQILKS